MFIYSFVSIVTYMIMVSNKVYLDFILPGEIKYIWIFIPAGEIKSICIFIPVGEITQRHIVLGLCGCSTVHLSIIVNLACNFWSTQVKEFIFGMHISSVMLFHITSLLTTLWCIDFVSVTLLGGHDVSQTYCWYHSKTGTSLLAEYIEKNNS